MRQMELLIAIEETKSAPPTPQSKIMVVDDDADLCRALKVRLRAQHYQVVSASDGYSALALAQKERPDLVLLDLGLPGVDGFAGLWMRLPQGQHLAGRFVAHPSQDTVNEND